MSYRTTKTKNKKCYVLVHSSSNSYLPSWPTILNCKSMMTTTTTTTKQNNVVDDDDDDDRNRQKTERIYIFLLFNVFSRQILTANRGMV